MNCPAKGFEALIRWHHRERGMVASGELIPTTEQSGSIAEIGIWVIEELGEHMTAW